MLAEVAEEQIGDGARSRADVRNWRQGTLICHGANFNHPHIKMFAPGGCCLVGYGDMTERTLILIKPDGVANGHVGEIISRIERKGLKLVEMDLRTADRETAEKHYAEHKDKPFFGELVDFITSAPLVAGIVEGERAIEAWRQLAGGTDPVAKATPGTIRGDFALTVGENVVHGSDSPESAEREIAIWFPNK